MDPQNAQNKVELDNNQSIVKPIPVVETNKLRVFLKKYKFVLILGVFVFLAGASALIYIYLPKYMASREIAERTYVPSPTDSRPTSLPVVTNNQELGEIPNVKVLDSNYHVFQTFNNCGPASLSMVLRYFGIEKSQGEIGNDLRPYQIASGDNDDKSVSLEELAQKAEEFGLLAYHRPAGNMDILKHFIANDMPVITRTWVAADDDVGHYRVVKGYDENQGVLIQDDSLQGKNLTYTYDEFNVIWKKFNYEFVVIVPKEKQSVAETILGPKLDEGYAWQEAVEMSRGQLAENPNDVTARFNLVVALYNTGDLEGTVNEFEKIENDLSFRTLWYQIEPIKAYFELGNYDRVFAITDKILNGGNRAFSELYIIRGDIYKSQGNIDAARTEYEKAVQYNVNLEEAKEKLNSL